MKKLVINDIFIIFTLTCYLYPLNGYSQQINQKNKNVISDLKFWFSIEQLKHKAKIAILKGLPFTRCYVKGKEFTEEGEIKTSDFTDSKLVLRISGNSNKTLIIKCIVVDPYDVIEEHFTVKEVI